MKAGKERIKKTVFPMLFLTTLFISLLFLIDQTTCFATTVVLQWDPVSDPALAGYRVYYQADSSVQPFQGTGAAQGNAPVGTLVTAPLRSSITASSAFPIRVT